MIKNTFTIALLITELLISVLSLLALVYTENLAYLLALFISAAGVIYAACSTERRYLDLLENHAIHYHFVYITEKTPVPFEAEVPHNRRW